MAATTLVLIGRTGNGKSSTGNSILGGNVFVTKRSSKSVTKQCKHGQREWKDGRIINVIDTPGLFDTDATKGFIEREIVRCIDLAKDGVHGFILVLSLQNRFTEEEADAFEKLQLLFGPKIIDYMTIVFTGGDLLEDNDDGFTLGDYLSDSASSLTKLIRRCDTRIVVFDNRTKLELKKQDQIAKLLDIVDRNVAENGNCPYTNEVFEKAKSMASQLYYIRDKDKAYEEQIKLLNDVMAKNLHDMMEKMETMKKGLQEQLKYMEKQKDKFREEIDNLREQLRDAQENLKRAKELKTCQCFEGCTIV